jgi:hypothetical protein
MCTVSFCLLQQWTVLLLRLKLNQIGFTDDDSVCFQARTIILLLLHMVMFYKCWYNSVSRAPLLLVGAIIRFSWLSYLTWTISEVVLGSCRVKSFLYSVLFVERRCEVVALLVVAFFVASLFIRKKRNVVSPLVSFFFLQSFCCT